MNTTDEYFEAMKLAYLYKLDQKMSQIEQEALRAAHYENDFDDNISQLYGSLHKLIGSSGIYGFNTIAYSATTFLDWVKPIKETPYPFTTEDKDHISLLLNDLKHSVSTSLQCEIADQVDKLDSSAEVIEPPPSISAAVKAATKGFVYVVDDDRDQAMALEFYLMQAGFEVAWFESLQKAEEAIANTMPAAVIMDMGFPEGELAGAKAIKRIKQEKGNLPVIFLSVRRDIEARLAATRAGASHYFTKPVDITRMIGELNKVIKKSQDTGGRILLVDDDEDITGLMGIQFDREGFEVEVLNKPLYVFSAIEKFNPDLLLIDLHMPQCNGLELASVIRQHEVYYDLPIMFLTSDDDPSAKVDAMLLGSDDFFSKKLEPALLVKAVKARLKRIKEFAKVKEVSVWSPN